MNRRHFFGFLAAAPVAAVLPAVAAPEPQGGYVRMGAPRLVGERPSEFLATPKRWRVHNPEPMQVDWIGPVYDPRAATALDPVWDSGERGVRKIVPYDPAR